MKREWKDEKRQGERNAFGATFGFVGFMHRLPYRFRGKAGILNHSLLKKNVNHGFISSRMSSSNRGCQPT